MAGKPIEDLLALVNQVLAACVQATARSMALEALLIDKGFVTKAEIDTKTQQVDSDAKHLSDSLLNFGEKNQA
jgi:hypothetical protein